MSASDKKAIVPHLSKQPAAPDMGKLFSDIRSLIDSARWQVARTVDAGLVMLYWGIGMRIRVDILNEKRAAYGEQILPTLSAKLVPEYGEGFSAKRFLCGNVQVGELERPCSAGKDRGNASRANRPFQEA